MPAKTNNRTTAQRTRERLKRRSPKQKPARQRGQGSPAAADFVADSIFELKLDSKKGAEVFFTHNGEEEITHKDAEQMYKELYASYERIYTAVKGEETRDVHQLGIDMPVAFHHMLNNLKMGLLPSGYRFNVEFDEHCGAAQKYFFVIYHECEWPLQWHEFEVGPALLHLAKCNKPLHDLFLSFLKCFRACGIDLWHEGFMGATLDYMGDVVEEYLGSDEEVAASMNAAIENYSKGDASRYAKLIVNAKTVKPGEMRRRAKLYKKDQEIANLIHHGSVIIEDGNNLRKYRYEPVKEEEGWDTYLDLDSQCNIIWDWEDALSNEHRETLDSHANNGVVQEPVWHRAIIANSKDFDFITFAKEVRWPRQLSNFFETANDLLHKYSKKIKKYERANRKPGKRV